MLTFIITENGRIEADKGKNDDLIMSLGVAVTLLHILVSTGAIEIKHHAVDATPLTPLTTTTVTDAFGGMTEEEYKWLIN